MILFLMLRSHYWSSIGMKLRGQLKCQQPSTVHVLNVPAKSARRAQLFFRVSSFVRPLVQQGMSIMSPVMEKVLVDVSAGVIRVIVDVGVA